MNCTHARTELRDSTRCSVAVDVGLKHHARLTAGEHDVRRAALHDPSSALVSWSCPTPATNDFTREETQGDQRRGPHPPPGTFCGRCTSSRRRQSCRCPCDGLQSQVKSGHGRGVGEAAEGSRQDGARRFLVDQRRLEELYGEVHFTMRPRRTAPHGEVHFTMRPRRTALARHPRTWLASSASPAPAAGGSEKGGERDGVDRRATPRDCRRAARQGRAMVDPVMGRMDPTAATSRRRESSLLVRRGVGSVQASTGCGRIRAAAHHRPDPPLEGRERRPRRGCSRAAGQHGLDESGGARRGSTKWGWAPVLSGVEAVLEQAGRIGWR